MKNRYLVMVLAVVLMALVAVAVWQAMPRTSLPTTSATTGDMRDTQTVFRGFTTEFIQALRIDDPYRDEDLILERNQEGQWRLAGRSDGTLDPLIADNIAKTVAFMPYQEIIGGIAATDYVNFGLNAESVWLQIQVILKTTETYNIAVGGLVPGSENGYYALIDDRPEIYVLNRGAVEYLEAYLRQIQALQLLDKNFNQS